MATTLVDSGLTPVARTAARAPAGGPSPVMTWALGLTAWAALALLSSLQTWISLRSAGQNINGAYLLSRNLVDWYTCAIFTPFYFWMVRRWPLQRTAAVRTLCVYAVLTAVIVVLKYALYVPLVNGLTADAARQTTLARVLTGSFIRENIAFWCMLAAVLTVEYYRLQREREMREARLQTQLAEARLDALTAQLHPHFLFNTIQGISTLIHRDAEAADAMLARLSTLLRHTLQRDAGHEITLAEELELLDLYLGIVQERFGDRLEVMIDVAPETQDVLVPRLLLQPLVENALQHGIARSARRGRVEIRARSTADIVELTVSDDGPGVDPVRRPFPRDGIGLRNTRERLAQLYGADQFLDAGPAADGGFVVTVRLPVRRLAIA